MIRRISAELDGDQAIMSDTLITALQIQGSRKEKDSQLISLSLDALEVIIEQTKESTGKRFPSIDDIYKEINRVPLETGVVQD